jgi:outer membrane protein assembly factor BamC
MKHIRLVVLPLLAFLLMAGCSSTGNKSMEYRSAQTKQNNSPLEIPPELSSPTIDDRFAVPDPKAQTTFSTYSRDRAAGPQIPSTAGVLPAVDGIRVERSGTQRWLVVKTTPDKVWPVAREFWIEKGFTIQRENPQAGIMETDWAEDRAKIPQDVIRRTIGRVFDGLYSTPQRDKFRTRLEKSADGNSTEVYVSHRGMEEVYTSNAEERTIWQPRPPNPELEAEFLQLLALKFGYDDKKTVAAAGLNPATKAASATTGGTTLPTPESRNAVLENNGAGPLVVNDGFDRAWRRVGLALDRVGFTVEDRDRSKGVFFVRYIDPEVDLKTGEKQGFMEKLAFWKPAPKAAQPQYRIHVADAGTNLSQVEVQSQAGTPEASPTGKKILNLLYDQLK